MKTPQFLLGIKEIDKSHARLLNIIQKLEDCFAKGQPYPRDEINELLNDAEDFATQHFRQEEDLMVVFGYPQLRQHRAEHDKFMQKLEAIRQFKDDELVSGGEIHEFSHFLNDWFKLHIGTTDLKYADWIRSQVLR